MKKILLGLALVLSVMMVLSCGTLNSQKAIDSAFQQIYDKYYDDLILDGATHYTVVSGDTMVHIAQTHYHNEYHFPMIMLASHNIVKDPDQIVPGMQLTIPDLQRNLNNAETKAKLKLYYVDISRLYDRRNHAQFARSLRELALSM